MQESGQTYMPAVHQEQMKKIMDLIPDDVQLWNDPTKWDGKKWPNGGFMKPNLIVIKSKESVINIIGEYFSKGSQRQRLVGYREHDYVSVMFNFDDTTEMKTSGRGKNKTTTSVRVKRKPQVVRFESTGKVLTKNGSPVPASTMTAMQELGTLWVFRQVIQNDKKFNKWQDIKNDVSGEEATWPELVKIWDEIGNVAGGPEDKWLQIFFKQNDIFMKKMSDPKIKLLEEFNRGATHAGGKPYNIPGSKKTDTFMEFISNHVKQYGISQKDNWNPADIWLIKDEQKWRNALIKHSSVEGSSSPSSIANNLQQCNAILRDAWAKHEIIGISLKAIGSGDTARWEAVNTTTEFINKRSDINFRLTFELDEIRCFLQIDKDGGVTQDSWVYIDNGEITYKFQIKANNSSDRSGSNLKYEGQQEGAGAARLGKATVDLLLNIMKEAGIPFDREKKSYPMSVEQLVKKETEYRKKLKFLASKGVKLSNDGTQTADMAYDALLYLMNREAWVANSKCQQITWLYQLLNLEGQKQQEFLADLVFLSKKEGKRYGPFGKIY